MDPVVKTTNLTKEYDGTPVVKDLNLEVEEGEIFGFLGPNGAGKSTSILMILGLTEPTSGEATVAGYDATREPLEVKRRTGYLPENVGFYDNMSARENLRYITRLNGIPDKNAEGKIERALEMVGLSDAIDQRAGTFSRGMKQRLGIADVLVKEPKVVFLDEPTLGIDPEGASEILDLIVDMAEREGITVVLSSHLLEQVQRICDRVGIMSDGKLVASGTLAGLGEEVVSEGGNLLHLGVSEVNEGLEEDLREIEGVEELTREEDGFRLRSKKDVSEEVARVVYESGAVPTQMRSKDFTLEELYMRYFREQ
ncbi:MAG: ABC transporter ATP-binding protein [Candidatus Bipolaricaulia bacterium]